MPGWAKNVMTKASNIVIGDLSGRIKKILKRRNQLKLMSPMLKMQQRERLKLISPKSKMQQRKQKEQVRYGSMVGSKMQERKQMFNKYFNQ